MALKRPPQHKIDGSQVFIHPEDDAWDQDKIEASRAEHGKLCPVDVYFSGESRYHLSAELEHGRADVFLNGTSPTEFHLRRLDTWQWHEVQGLREREVIAQSSPVPRQAHLAACRYGLAKVVAGNSGRILLEPASDRGLSVDELEQLAEMSELGPELLVDIGRAVYLASKPLRDDEKKP